MRLGDENASLDVTTENEDGKDNDGSSDGDNAEIEDSDKEETKMWEMR